MAVVSDIACPVALVVTAALADVFTAQDPLIVYEMFSEGVLKG